MKCESWHTNEAEVELLAEEGKKPFLLCERCQHRLLNKALRPLEFFNLASVHAYSHYLHDDFMM